MVLRVTGLAVTAGLILWLLWPQSVPFGKPLPGATPVTKTLVVKLLDQSLSDDSNKVRRDGISHWTWLVPQSAWDRKYPVAFAQEKLVFLGQPAVQHLVDVMDDESASRKMRERAGMVAAYFDDPRVLPALRAAASKGLLDSWQVFGVLNRLLPLSKPTGDLVLKPVGHLEGDALLRWLDDAADRPYEQLCLAELDAVMKATTYPDGGIQGVWDHRALRWLNRLYDIDFDEWCRGVAPHALNFRNEQLKKGYDPAIALRRFGRNLYSGIPDEGILAVIPNPTARTACHELIEVVEGGAGLLPLHPKPRPGWEDRLREWYWANRPYFVYDFQRHRFVVDKGKIPGSTTTSAPSQERGHH